MSNVLPIVAAVLVLGIAVQLVARRLRIPSVIFLMLVGVALGSEGLGIVTRQLFGDALAPIVGLSVAIIVFDGAYNLRRERIREASRAAFLLVTVGALLTFVGISAAVYLILGAGWQLSLLVGALLVATGPTVITPILEVVKVREPVAAALETEGIVNDVTAAIAAIAVFETFVVGDGGVVEGFFGFSFRIGVGVAVGVLVAVSVAYIMERVVATAAEPAQAARFLTLGGAVAAYGGAEAVAAEAGVAAAAAGGLVLGNLGVPHDDEIEVFGRDLTLIVLSFVFISLAAIIEFDVIRDLGIAGIAVVVSVTLVVRPVVIFVSVRGERFTNDERLFMSAVGPRGIIPASIATLFAVELSPAAPEQADVLVGTVFLVILTTVILQAGFARQIAEGFGVTPMKTIIVGGGRVGRTLAERLERRGEFVVIVEDEEEIAEKARTEGYTVHVGDGEDREVLRDAGAEDAKTLVAATADDNCNLLAAQHAKSEFGIERVIARVNQPTNVDAFDALGVRAIDAALATAWSIDNEIERPELAHWMNDLGDGHDVQEIEVTSNRLAGKRIADIDDAIPDGCIVAEVTRDGEAEVPDGDFVIEKGDHITLLGREDAVAEAIRRFHPHD